VSIRYGGRFYAVVKHERVDGAPQFVYDLRERRPEEAVVVVYEYDPNDAAGPERAPRRWMPGG
jgi:hypothetical protein